MEYRHIHYLNYEPGVEESVIFDGAVLLANQLRQGNYLLKIAAFICRHTDVDYVGIGLLDSQKSLIRTCTFLKKDKVLDNITYLLKGTPCEEVVIHRFCYYPFDVKTHFPNDKIIRDLQIESYLGTILLSRDNEAIGVVELLHTRTIEKPAFAEHLILILSPAIEEELMDLHANGKESC